MSDVFHEKLGDAGRRTCVSCSSNALRLVAILEQKGIPPGLPGYEIGYTHTVIVACDACGRTTIEKLTRDSFDFEDAWENRHEWLTLDDNDSPVLLEALGNCPEPLSPKCGCGIHLSLRSSLFWLPLDLETLGTEGDRTRPVTLEWRNDLPRIVLKPKTEDTDR